MLHNSNQPYIIYKSNNGFKLYFDFSKKIILKSKNDVENFLNFKSNKKRTKKTDLFIGFFGYELLNNLIDINLHKQNSLNFYKGIFYKPESVLSIYTINYKSKSKFDTLDFFFRLSQFNFAPESYMIRDKDFLIVICSP